MSSTFLRGLSETNSNVIVCHCTLCGTLVGASPSDLSLGVMEDLHECAGKAQNSGASPLPAVFSGQN